MTASHTTPATPSATDATDGIAWLAAPRSIVYGGYSVLLARGLGSGELVDRFAATVLGPERAVCPVGEVTGEELVELLEDEYGGVHEEIALRHGEHEGWAYAVMYGGWPSELGSLLPVSRDGAHVFHLVFEEENGKPVPPWFTYVHDERLLCAFNLHLDRSWGHDGVEGEPEAAAPLQRLLNAAGLPDENLPHRDAHRVSLEVLERHFALTLPRARILGTALPAVVLESD
ncbi:MULTISPECIES: hypothetical protein [unclassified Streptomyces]|uniref:hypothetical protein n=1 Tax=unclassified Streptomyces TaxID=2593676 RepID=UPI0007C8C962|nr:MULTISPECIES: hypothetical protein [unclassified Streptomyces]